MPVPSKSLMIRVSCAGSSPGAGGDHGTDNALVPREPCRVAPRRDRRPRCVKGSGFRAALASPKHITTPNIHIGCPNPPLGFGVSGLRMTDSGSGLGFSLCCHFVLSRRVSSRRDRRPSCMCNPWQAGRTLYPTSCSPRGHSIPL